MKKFGTIALSLALAGSMTLPALAADTPELVAAPAGTGYGHTITLNGEALDLTGIPGAPSADLLPLRLLAEADHGSAFWDEENNEGWFTFGSNQIIVKFSDNTVTVNDTPAEVGGVSVVNGVTFISADVFEGWEGYTVTTDDKTGSTTVTTPNNDPLVKLAYSMMDTSEMFGTRADGDTLTEAYKIPADQFEQVVAFFPMITSPDTIIVGKLIDGANVDAVKQGLEAYRKSQEDTFSWYLSQNLPKVQDARTLVEDGYLLFFIGNNADEVETLFHTYVEAQG